MRYSVNVDPGKQKVALQGSSGKQYEFRYLIRGCFAESQAGPRMRAGIKGVYVITSLRGSIGHGVNHTVVFLDESSDVKAEMTALRASELWDRFRKEGANCLLLHCEPSASARVATVADLGCRCLPTPETSDPGPKQSADARERASSNSRVSPE
jgi:hypothetical protein